MPPANLHGESTPDFIVPIYIECRFEFIEAQICHYIFVKKEIVMFKKGKSWRSNILGSVRVAK